MLFEEINKIVGPKWEEIVEDREAAIRCLRHEVKVSLDCVRNIATDCISNEKSFELSDKNCIDLLVAEFKVLDYLLDLSN